MNLHNGEKRELHDWFKCFILAALFNMAGFAFWFFLLDKKEGLYLYTLCVSLVLIGGMFTLGTWKHGLYVFKDE